MTECLFRANVNGKFETYTCSQVKESHFQWKQTFREQNGTDRIIATGGKDEAYNHFCESIDRFLNQCKHDPIELQCPQCEATEHEGYFCRCESRNIALAKHLRQKQKDNRGQDYGLKHILL